MGERVGGRAGRGVRGRPGGGGGGGRAGGRAGSGQVGSVRKACWVRSLVQSWAASRKNGNSLSQGLVLCLLLKLAAVKSLLQSNRQLWAG